MPTQHCLLCPEEATGSFYFVDFYCCSEHGDMLTKISSDLIKNITINGKDDDSTEELDDWEKREYEKKRKESEKSSEPVTLTYATAPVDIYGEFANPDAEILSESERIAINAIMILVKTLLPEMQISPQVLQNLQQVSKTMKRALFIPGSNKKMQTYAIFRWKFLSGDDIITELSYSTNDFDEFYGIWVLYHEFQGNLIPAIVTENYTLDEDFIKNKFTYSGFISAFESVLKKLFKKARDEWKNNETSIVPKIYTQPIITLGNIIRNFFPLFPSEIISDSSIFPYIIREIRINKHDDPRNEELNYIVSQILKGLIEIPDFYLFRKEKVSKTLISALLTLFTRQGSRNISNPISNILPLLLNYQTNSKFTSPMKEMHPIFFIGDVVPREYYRSFSYQVYYESRNYTFFPNLFGDIFFTSTFVNRKQKIISLLPKFSKKNIIISLLIYEDRIIEFSKILEDLEKNGIELQPKIIFFKLCVLLFLIIHSPPEVSALYLEAFSKIPLAISDALESTIKWYGNWGNILYLVLPKIFHNLSSNVVEMIITSLRSEIVWVIANLFTLIDESDIEVRKLMKIEESNTILAQTIVTSEKKISKLMDYDSIQELAKFHTQLSSRLLMLHLGLEMSRNPAIIFSAANGSYLEKILQIPPILLEKIQKFKQITFVGDDKVYLTAWIEPWYINELTLKQRALEQTSFDPLE